MRKGTERTGLLSNKSKEETWQETVSDAAETIFDNAKRAGHFISEKASDAADTALDFASTAANVISTQAAKTAVIASNAFAFLRTKVAGNTAQSDSKNTTTLKR